MILKLDSPGLNTSIHHANNDNLVDGVPEGD